MKLVAIGKKIIVQRDPEEEQQGLLLPDAVRTPPRTGKVLSIGEEIKYIKEGDKVYFHEYAGHFVKESQNLDETDLMSMGEDEVLAVEREE